MSKPSKYALVTGSAEGRTKLTAFDNALLNAGVGNLNLIRVSSILPPNTTREDSLATLPAPGSLLPIAYGSMVCDTPGAVISAAVGIGLGDYGDYGVIMEVSGEHDKKTAEKMIAEMIREAFESRGRELKKVEIVSTEHTVKGVGCVFAAVPMWWDQC